MKKILHQAKPYAAGSLLAVLVFSLILIWSAGCGGAHQSLNPLDWGSRLAEIDGGGAHAQFTNVCGSSRLSGPLQPDSNGNFSLTGSYPAGGTIPANFNGHISGNTMTLTVTNSADNQTIKIYSLIRGVNGQITQQQCP